MLLTVWVETFSIGLQYPHYVDRKFCPLRVHVKKSTQCIVSYCSDYGLVNPILIIVVLAATYTSTTV